MSAAQTTGPSSPRNPLALLPSLQRTSCVCTHPAGRHGHKEELSDALFSPTNTRLLFFVATAPMVLSVCALRELPHGQSQHSRVVGYRQLTACGTRPPGRRSWICHNEAGAACSCRRGVGASALGSAGGTGFAMLGLPARGSLCRISSPN